MKPAQHIRPDRQRIAPYQGPSKQTKHLRTIDTKSNRLQRMSPLAGEEDVRRRRENREWIERRERRRGWKWKNYGLTTYLYPLPIWCMPMLTITMHLRSPSSSRSIWRFWMLYQDSKSGPLIKSMAQIKPSWAPAPLFHSKHNFQLFLFCTPHLVIGPPVSILSLYRFFMYF